jgi:hypothetical protein
MALKFGFESQKPKKEREHLVKEEARELREILHTQVNTDFYMPSLTQKFDKDTEDVVQERHEIVNMIQDELRKNHIEYDLGMRVVEDGEEKILEVVIRSDVFVEVADREEWAHMREYLENGEFVIKFAERDEDEHKNFEVEEGAPVEYWLNKASTWDKLTLPTLRTAVGTVGKVKLLAHFTNEGLHFTTFTNRFVSDKGEPIATIKSWKGFSLQS